MRMVLSRVRASMAFCSRSSFSGSTLAVASSRTMMGGVLQHGPGDGDALPLTAGEVGAASAHYGVKALLQTGDEAVTARRVGGCLHLGVCCITAAHADILPDGIVKEVVVWETKAT